MRRSLPLRVLHHEWIINGKQFKTHPGGQDGAKTSGGTVLFLHGLLGSGKNLRAPAKKLTQRHPGLTALLLDARGHGKSPSLTPEHSLANAAKDVVDTCRSLGLSGSEFSPVGVIGHSFGGRLALEYLRGSVLDTPATDEHDEVLPPKVTWILDSVPGEIEKSVGGVVESVATVPLPMANKNELVSHLVDIEGVKPAIAYWMTTNLKGDSKQGFQFAFDLDVVRPIMEDFPKQPIYRILKDVDQAVSTKKDSDKTYNRKCQVNVVRAERNKAWTPDVLQQLNKIELRDVMKDKNDKFFKLHTLKDAGHWVHVDNLEGLMDIMDDSFYNATKK